MRRLAVLILLAAAGVLVSGCSRIAQDRDQVLSAIAATEQQSRSYDYAVAAGGHHVDVKGLVADDFRYRADASVDGQPLASEVVADDARALRFDNSTAPALIASAGGGDVHAAEALATGRWLVDPTGAASLAQTSAPTHPTSDPLSDSLTALEYVRNAVTAARTVQKYNPESEDYRPKLDPFPAPAAGVIRYDLVPPDLAQRQQVGTGNIGVENAVPGVPFFRLMAVYVRDGLVREVREQIAVQPRLEDSESNLEARLGDFVTGVADAPEDRQVNALLDAVNRQLRLQGQPEVAPRSMHLTLTIGGTGPVAVPEDSTQADLSALGSPRLLLYETS